MKNDFQIVNHQPTVVLDGAHNAAAAEKLAATLRQPMTEKLLKAADAVLRQDKDPDKIKIIETVKDGKTIFSATQGAVPGPGAG